jgi:hypothetical protein
MQFLECFALSLGEEQFVLVEGGEVDFEQSFVVLFKDIFRVEVAWHEEVEESPQLDESVLDGGAGEDESM